MHEFVINNTMDFKKIANILTGLLVIQFGLGILANLDSLIPSKAPSHVLSHIGFIFFHAINGFAIFFI